MYSKAIEFDPKHASAHVNLGVLLKKREDYDEAEAMYRKAIELEPERVNAHWNLSILLETRGDVEGAIRETREYIRKGDPENDGEARVKKLLAKQAA